MSERVERSGRWRSSAITGVALGSCLIANAVFGALPAIAAGIEVNDSGDVSQVDVAKSFVESPTVGSSKWADGDDYHVIKINLKDAAGDPLSGVASESIQVCSNNAPAIETAEKGTYEARVTSVVRTVQGCGIFIDNYSARIGWVSGLVFEESVLDPRRSSWSASKGARFADGKDAHSVDIELWNTAGSPFSGAAVGTVAVCGFPATETTTKGVYRALVTTERVGVLSCDIKVQGVTVGNARFSFADPNQVVSTTYTSVDPVSGIKKGDGQDPHYVTIRLRDASNLPITGVAQQKFSACDFQAVKTGDVTEVGAGNYIVKATAVVNDHLLFQCTVRVDGIAVGQVNLQYSN